MVSWNSGALSVRLLVALTGQDLSPRDFAVHVVRQQLVAPEFNFEDVNTWPDVLLMNIASLWKEDIGLTTTYDTSPSEFFNDFQVACLAYSARFHERMQENFEFHASGDALSRIATIPGLASTISSIRFATAASMASKILDISDLKWALPDLSAPTFAQAMAKIFSMPGFVSTAQLLASTLAQIVQEASGASGLIIVAGFSPVRSLMTSLDLGVGRILDGIITTDSFAFAPGGLFAVLPTIEELIAAFQLTTNEFLRALEGTGYEFAADYLSMAVLRDLENTAGVMPRAKGAAVTNCRSALT